MLKFVSWNVNGIRACLKKGFLDFFKDYAADFFCLQEIKAQEEQVSLVLDGYYQYWNSAERKGYSGTAIFTKHKPLKASYGINGDYLDEGRVITLEYPQFFLVTVYSPNSQEGLLRLDYRQTFEDVLRAYLIELKSQKEVIICGDLNVAHQEIDLKNPSINTRNPGFTIEEREKFSLLLEAGFIDSFRHLYPTRVKYSWWSYRSFARPKGIGWRIDYFVLSKGLLPYLKDSLIHDEIYGSDHCPVALLLDL
ncbi:exodeoxyribonuclease III [bacterium]|jgi:exodeoxyribonuclease-3|nr:exodeoxyribonuclease III [bacterium]